MLTTPCCRINLFRRITPKPYKCARSGKCNEVQFVGAFSFYRGLINFARCGLNYCALHSQTSAESETFQTLACGLQRYKIQDRFIHRRFMQILTILWTCHKFPWEYLIFIDENWFLRKLCLFLFSDESNINPQMNHLFFINYQKLFFGMTQLMAFFHC